jgi:hypothetical protein
MRIFLRREIGDQPARLTGPGLCDDGDRHTKGQRKRRLVTQDNRFRLTETPQQAASRQVQEYSLAERAAEFVHGRPWEHPEGRQPA